MQLYCNSLTRYSRLKTREVKIGDLLMGNLHPIRIQTMTTTDTLDTQATIEQSIRCIRAGAELVRITAPSKKEAENLLQIRKGLQERGYDTPLVADIHFTPNAAEIAARIVEKVRINPGNYIDKKKFEFIEYTDTQYNEEMERIYERFSPLVKICKEYGTAMRIGANHGSLSDRIMSRYGDTPMGMVESAMEFLRVARLESYHNIVLSMKSSNPLVMAAAYRLLVNKMEEEFGELYPLHLGVTEAGDGEDGRIKSAIGIGSLLEDGIGDTIRVSLTEDPEFEIPVCKDLVKRYEGESGLTGEKNKDKITPIPAIRDSWLPYSPFEYKRRKTSSVSHIGGNHPPIVIADYGEENAISRESLQSIGYVYDQDLDKWNLGDNAADYIYTGKKTIDFPLPGSLKILCDYENWRQAVDKEKQVPLLSADQLLGLEEDSGFFGFASIDANSPATEELFGALKKFNRIIPTVYSTNPTPILSVRRFIVELMDRDIPSPVVLKVTTTDNTIDKQLIHFSTEAGALLLDGMGDGIWLKSELSELVNVKISGRTYLESNDQSQFINNTSFSILQATRTRISKTEYISCPSCGRTLFDLQETTAKIRARTNHLKGVKIAIMGCIVNGPGEMADADFGYVGSGPGKITLYKGKLVVKRGVSSHIAVEELIELIKESEAWVEP